jgi:ADP-heptose:LPS heptosyltransferase
VSTPVDIFVLHTGGLGDLVLASGLLAALRTAHPTARLTLCCREPVAPVAALLPFALDEIVELSIDPFRWAAPSAELHAPLAAFAAQLAARGCDLFVSADYSPTWLTPVVAAALAPRQAVGRTAPLRAAGMADALRETLGFAAIAFTPDDCPERTPELERYAALLRLLDIDESAFPAVTVPSAADARAGEAFACAVDAAPPALACFTSSDALRRLPVRLLCETLVKAAREFGLQPLFLGGGAGSEEQAYQSEVAAAVRASSTAVAVALAPECGIPALAGILRRCHAFLGADTGLAHLASALGVPGVTFYGGGYWPAYRPWAPRNVGVVHPLPCFGCGWDCGFGHALCIESIDGEALLHALRQALAGPQAPPTVLECANLNSGKLTLIADAARPYRMAQADRHLRFDALVHLEHRADSDARRFAELTSQFERQRRLLYESLEQLEEKETEIRRAALAAAELREQLEGKEAELQHAAALAADEHSLHEKEAQIQHLAAENEMLRRAAEERLGALEASDGNRSAIEAESERRSVLIADLTEILEERDAEIVRLNALQNGATVS